MNSENNESQQETNVNTTSVTQKEELTNSQLNHSDTEINRAKKQKKSPWYFLGLLMLVIGGIAAWRTLMVSQEPSSIEQTEVKASASLPVRAVRSQVKPIEAWVFNNGEVAAVRFKHLTFQTAGTINYLKKIAGRDLREGDRRCEDVRVLRGRGATPREGTDQGGQPRECHRHQGRVRHEQGVPPLHRGICPPHRGTCREQDSADAN